MPVELEEIALFGLFTLKNKTIQIKEEHFLTISDLLKDLSPIKIEPQKLLRLGFFRYPGGAYYRKQGEHAFVLRPTKGSHWEFALGDGARIRTVAWIHQVQRLFFDLFDDHLFIPKEPVNKQ